MANNEIELGQIKVIWNNFKISKCSHLQIEIVWFPSLSKEAERTKSGHG